MRFTSAREHADVAARGVMTAPIGVPHTFICTVAPDLYIGYFPELSALIAQRGSLQS